MIDEVEDAYHDHLENIARNITSHHQGVRVVMLSGPSSSGKTTTAHLLRDYLTQYGAKSYIVSLDDFYRGVGLAPRLPDGEYNYESVEALDVEAIKQCLLDIITTGRFSVPSYNFALGRPTGQPRPYQLGEGDIVIVEGIHGLNPLFTRELPQGSCVKLYVSVKQQIKSANGDVISPMDLRLVRASSGTSSSGTPPRSAPSPCGTRWWRGRTATSGPTASPPTTPSTSIHIYEPCVMRTVAIPLLRAIAEDSPYYRKARDLEARLMRFEPISASWCRRTPCSGSSWAPSSPGKPPARGEFFLFFRREAPRFFTKNTKSKGIVSDLKGKML